jgi:hypothetical protein
LTAQVAVVEWLALQKTTRALDALLRRVLQGRRTTPIGWVTQSCNSFANTLQR